MVIKKLKVNARITEVDDISDRLLELYKKETALQRDAFLKNLFDDLEKQSLLLTDNMKKGVSLSQLEAIDIRRIRAVRNLNNAIKGYASMPVEDFEAPSKELGAIFKKYGVAITRENYSSKTSLIESLLKELSSPQVQESIEALRGVADVIAVLRKEQTAFITERTNYEVALSLKDSDKTPTSLKKAVMDNINTKLITYLTTMCMVDKDKYYNFAKLVSQVIDNVNSSIQKRKKEANKPEEKEEVEVES